MNMKTRIAKFLITLASFTMMTSASAYQGSDCCNPCSYDPCCPSPNRCFYAEADYIYWGVQQDGLRFAISGFGEECCNEQSSCNGNSCNSNNCNNNCDCKDQNLDWNSGFKIGAGMANPCCDWELFVQYTYYQANPKRCVERVDGDNCDLIGTWLPVPELLDLSLTRANNNWKLCFNNIDALITNEFCINNCFSFRPSFGLKGAWTHQKHNICYGFAELGSPEYRVCNKQDFWGVGPKFAMTATASIFDCFSLYGNLGLSTLYGSYDVKRNDRAVETTDTPPEESTRLVCLCSCRYHVQPVLETSFGLRWDTELCCGDYGFYVNLAWEHQIWFNHNDFIEMQNNANRNMTLHGVTVGAGISF